MDLKMTNLKRFIEGVYKKENVGALYKEYLSDIKNVTPFEIFDLMTDYMNQGNEPGAMLVGVDKLINVFHSALAEFQWSKPEVNTFLYVMMEENRGLKERLEAFKTITKDGNYNKEILEIKSFLCDIDSYEQHLAKLENILFPSMEKIDHRYEGLKIMWSLHNETRKQIKSLKAYVEGTNIERESFNIAIGQLFFKLYGLIEKQDYIMFPCASRIFTEKELSLMYLQCFDYEFVYMDRPVKPDLDMKKLLYDNNEHLMTGIIKTETGTLSFEQMELMMNHLPVDITFVDADDKVAYFSNPKERIFPRSVAVIGRDVRNCHPSESVDRVVKILEDFKSGMSDSESFWIQMKGLFILIQYFAVRNDLGHYLGTLEVSQEISHIRSLEGEKRL